MLSSAAMVSLHACPKTLGTSSSSFPPSNRFNTSSINRSSALQTNLLNRRAHVLRAMASLSFRHHHNNQRVVGKSGTVCFARISSTVNSQEAASVAVTPLVPPPPSSQFGSPLFWIGVGVGLSTLYTLVAANLKKYAMQQAFKTMMGQMNPQNNQFDNSAFSPTSPFPFPMPPTSGPATSPSPAASRTAVTVDVPMTKLEREPVAVSTASVDVKDGTDIKIESITYETDANTESKKYAFVDVSPEEAVLKTSFESLTNVEETSSSKDGQFVGEFPLLQNGAVHKQAGDSSDGSQSTRPVMSVEALEKMMEDPTVQKMVFPYLPAEMRNPATFKWMLQNPEYRQQLEDMLANMGGSPEWDTRMMDSLKNFDLSSPEVKQQFDQIGLTPEEVISKIMANPDVAMAFQNPRVQQAIMDCSQNPMSITKYQNDKEVMDVFNKISALFPGMSG